MSKLTQENLEKALKDNKGYSGAEPFILAMSRGSQQAIVIVNTVFVEILCSDKASLMSKLLVLRMFKDIFITGNMDAFDKIDPEVQEIIISAAAYNPKFRSKGKNDKQTRGGMFFIDTEKRTKNTQTIQLGNSFVLLATQIIKNFAAWLPQTPDEQPSRFLQAQKELQALGVCFDSNIYFQADQAKKFRKNYEAWLKDQQDRLESQKKQEKVEKEQKEQKEKVEKGEKQNPPQKIQKKGDQQRVNNIICSAENQELQKIKLENDQLQQKIKQKMDQISQLQQQIEVIQKKSREQKEELTNENISLKQSLQKQKEDKLILKQKVQNFLIQQHQHKNQQFTKLNQQKLSLQDQLRKTNQLKTDALERNLNLQIQVQELKTECCNLKQELEQRQCEYQRSLAQKNMERLKIQKNQVNQIQTLKQNLEKELKELKNLLIQKEKQNKKLTEQLELMNLKINTLQTEKQQMKNNFQKLRKEQQQEKSRVIQNVTLKNAEQEVRLIKQEKVEQKIQQRVIDNKYFTSNSFYSPFQEISKINMGSTGHLIQNKKSMSSFHKTESSKFRQTKQQFEAQGTLNRSSVWCKKTQTALVQRKTNLLGNKNKNVITSVFPFLPGYFPQIFTQCQHFGACCLLGQKKYSTFFRNEIFELRLIKSRQSLKTFHIVIKNTTFDILTIQVTPEPDQIKIREQNACIRIGSLNEAKLTLDTFVTDLNFRFIQAKEKKRKIFRIPVPITLLSFTQLSQSLKVLQRFDRFDQIAYKKHRSQRIAINSQIHNLMQGFPQISFCRSPDGGYQASTVMTYFCIPEVEIKLNMRSNQRSCEFQTQFLVESKISEAFSKVILQTLMFIFR